MWRRHELRGQLRGRAPAAGRGAAQGGHPRERRAQRLWARPGQGARDADAAQAFLVHGRLQRRPGGEVREDGDLRKRVGQRDTAFQARRPSLREGHAVDAHEVRRGQRACYEGPGEQPAEVLRRRRDGHPPRHERHRKMQGEDKGRDLRGGLRGGEHRNEGHSPAGERTAAQGLHQGRGEAHGGVRQEHQRCGSGSGHLRGLHL
mmetsp:Transcript_74439/g.210275  ORF Transcript_74439/g.210275 Transcript_74439/m.210275 type:complete len:204 (-) Transcript_74439:608-1219(-)